MAVSLVVLVAVDPKVDRWGVTFCKPCEDWRTLQHVDIIVRTCHAEERMTYPKIL